MNNTLLHSTLNILQHLLQTDASAKTHVIQLLNQQPQQPQNGAITRKNIGAADLLKKKHWSNQDRKEATTYVKLPASLNAFLTNNNMI